MNAQLPKQIRDYAVALAIVAAALLIRLLLTPTLGAQRPYLTLFGGIALAVWFTRWKPAALAAIIGFLVANYTLAAPAHAIAFNPFFVVEFALYALSAGFVIFCGEAMHRAHERAQREAAERKHAEDAEREQKELLRITFASIGDAAITTDTQARVTFLNPVAESITGWAHAAAVGRPLVEVFRVIDEQTRLPVENPVTRVLAEGKIVGLGNHTVLIAKDGAERPIDDSAAPIRDAQGRVQGVVLIFRDITERRKADEELGKNEQRTRSIVNNVIDGIITIDESGVVQSFNPAAERLFGYSATEVIGRNVKSLMPQPYHDQHDGYIANYLRTSEAKIIGIGREVEGRRQDGSTFPMDLAVSEFRIGDARYFTGIVRDISQRKEAELALRQSAEALRAKQAELDLVISRTPLLLTRCSRDLRYVFVNRACAEFFGHPAEEIVGRPIVEIMGKEAFAAITPHVQRVLRGEPVEFELEIPYAGLGRRFMQALYTPDRNEQGEVIGWIATVSDITDRKRAERQRDERAAELAVALAKRTEEMRRAETAERLVREADRRKDEFLATLAHELRNPLAPIRSSVAALKAEGPQDQAVAWCSDVIDRQAGHMARLLDDLLDVSRIAGKKLELRLERVTLSEVIESAIETSKPHIDGQRHELVVSLPKEPICLNADRVRLAQVFVNLLNNAAKYTEPGGKISLTVERQGSDAVVTVADSGIGIAAAMLPRIFEIFSQAAPAVARSQGGLGIGLALAQGLVQMHGGSIHVHSDGLGQGTTFEVRLPILIGEVAVPRPKPATSLPIPAQKHRILVADDNEDGAQTLARVLQVMGHDVRVVYDGQAAIEAIKTFSPTAALLDIGMPKLNGYEVARRLRDVPATRDLTLIALTGWGRLEDRRLTTEAGFDHHLVKPVEVAELCKLLETVSAPSPK